MTTETLTLAVTEAAEKTLESYKPILQEQIHYICPEDSDGCTASSAEAFYQIMKIIAAGTADTIVKSFAYAFNMDD